MINAIGTMNFDGFRMMWSEGAYLLDSLAYALRDNRPSLVNDNDDECFLR